MLQFLTDFADQALILPTIVLIGVWLALAEPRRTVLAWIGCSVFVLGMIGVLKLILPCTPFVTTLRSPSGHTASAVLVAGGLLILLSGAGLWRRILATASGVVIGAGIGATRLALGAHTPAEVVAGAAVGASGLILFARTDMPRPRLPPVTLMVACALLAIAVHGLHLHAEQWVSTLACPLDPRPPL